MSKERKMPKWEQAFHDGKDGKFVKDGLRFNPGGGCVHCGCVQFEKDPMHFARPKNLILCVCTGGLWYGWLIVKQIFKGAPTRCMACRRYLKW